MAFETTAIQAGRDLYQRLGANLKLAEAMACVLNASHFAPNYRTLEEGLGQARTGREYSDICLDCILRGETDTARKYLAKLIEAEKSATKRTLEKFVGLDKVEIGYDKLAELILREIDKVLEIYAMATSEEINSLREMGLAPIENYIRGARFLIIGSIPREPTDAGPKHPVRIETTPTITLENPPTEVELAEFFRDLRVQ